MIGSTLDQQVDYYSIINNYSASNLYFHCSLTDNYNLCTDLEMRENEAIILSELQENFEMSKSICYTAMEPRSFH